MALITKGLKKGAGKRMKGYKGGGGIRKIKKQIPGTKLGQQTKGPGIKKTTPGIQKPIGPGTKQTNPAVKIKTKPIPGRKQDPGIKKTLPGVKKPNRGAQIAKKKKIFATQRANKLANQKKLAARKRKRKMA